MNQHQIHIIDYEASCAVGPGLSSLRDAIQQQKTGLKPNNFPGCDLPTYIGRVDAIDDHQWQADEVEWKSRNNALIDIALRQGSFLQSLEKVKSRIDNKRIGLVMGSSTSSIDRSEEAYRFLENEKFPAEFFQENVLNPHAPGLFVAHRLGLKGPNLTINTACSSSAKVFATACRWLNAGVVDAVVVGGADTLCLSVLYGFHSLQLVSKNLCCPFDAARDGINLGEAAGFAILMRSEDADFHSGIQLSGYGESSDAHHMSHPHPEGSGARLAIEQALKQSQLNPADIGYINLHGTASQANDHIEGNLVGKLFPESCLKSSTKGWTGHTLGAAGILEAIIAMEALSTGIVPGNLHLQNVDSEIDIQLSAKNSRANLQHVMSNSFGFGGNNACLIFSRSGEAK
jgi:3-oxoacyl-[acyl-carrier-protein] synthase-1